MFGLLFSLFYFDITRSFTFCGTDVVLDDFLVAEDSPAHSDLNSPASISGRASIRNLGSSVSTGSSR